MPDIPVWPLISDQSSLRASESPEQKNCEQKQEDHNGNSNVQLCAADLFIRLNVFGARETGDEAFGKALHNGKSEHGGCDLIHRFRQETGCKHSLYYAPASFYQVRSDQTSPASGDATIDKK